MLGRDAHHARAVGDDDVARSHAHAAAGDRLVDGGDGQPGAPRQRRHVAREHGERVLHHLLAVAHAAVDHQAGDALELGRQRRQPAEGGDAMPAVVDDEDVAGLRPRRSSCRRLKSSDVKSPRWPVISRTVTARPTQRVPGTIWARPCEHALEGDVVERIGERRRRQRLESLEEARRLRSWACSRRRGMGMSGLCATPAKSYRPAASCTTKDASMPALRHAAPAALVLALLAAGGSPALAANCADEAVTARGEAARYEVLAKAKARGNWRAKVRAMPTLGAALCQLGQGLGRRTIAAARRTASTSAWPSAIPAGIRPFVFSEQADDLALGVDVDGVCRRHPGQARHGHDLTADRHDELGTGREPDLAHG